MTSTSQLTAQEWDHVRAGRLPQAQALFEQALGNDPQSAAALDGLGWVAYSNHKFDLAEQYYRQALAADPRFAEAHLHRASLYRATGPWDEAVAGIQAAIDLDPSQGRFHGALGSVFHERKQFDRAADCYRRALEISPTDLFTLLNLTDVMFHLDDPVQAEALARRAIQLAPRLGSAHLNLGCALERQANPRAAAEAFAGAVQFDPNNQDAHWNLAASLLLSGEFEKAWPHFDARLHSQINSGAFPEFTAPMWNGQDLAGKTLLVQAEQGLGDSIQFCRFIPLAAQRFGKVVFRCPQTLAPLMQSLAGNIEIITLHENAPSHVYIPLLSLPRIFKTTLQTIPNHVPYLGADRRKSAALASQITGDGARVGLVWAGNPEHQHDRSRSIDPPLFAPLAQIPGIQWISLQKGCTDSPPLPLQNFDERLQDFSDTAALIANLDLVIGVDTSVIHLAGALAQPVWTMIPFAPDWRWLLDRNDSPWYPTMRLFRQPSAGNWKAVIDSLANELRNFIAASRARRMMSQKPQEPL